MSGNMPKPLLVPLLLTLSLIPEGHKRLAQVGSIIEATQNAVQLLRTGLDGFYSTLLEVSESFNPKKESAEENPAVDSEQLKADSDEENTQ